MLPAGRSCLLLHSLTAASPCLKRDRGHHRSWGQARNSPGVALQHRPAALSSTHSRRDGARGCEKAGDHQGAACYGLGGATEGAEGILRGHDAMLKLQRAAPGMPEAAGSPEFPSRRGFLQHSEGLGAPCRRWQGHCAVQGHLGATLRSLVLWVTQCPEGSPGSSGCFSWAPRREQWSLAISNLILKVRLALRSRSSSLWEEQTYLQEG